MIYCSPAPPPGLHIFIPMEETQSSIVRVKSHVTAKGVCIYMDDEHQEENEHVGDGVSPAPVRAPFIPGEDGEQTKDMSLDELKEHMDSADSFVVLTFTKKDSNTIDMRTFVEGASTHEIANGIKNLQAVLLREIVKTIGPDAARVFGEIILNV